MKNEIIAFFIFISVFSFVTKAKAQNEHPYVYPTDTAVLNKLQQWQDWKFGVIIHWGAYSQWGVVESWSLCPEDESWCVRTGEFSDDYYAYTKKYEEIRKSFNPTDFNPEKWAEACKNAGMKYVVFTTKHHDGFCMFDSYYTDYKITDTESAFAQNPKRNVAKEVFNAFRNEGMHIGAYFSKPDWHHNDYWWPYFPVFDRNVNYNPEKYPEKWNRFKQFTYNQINELMKDYGSIDILWLDGGWVRPGGSLTDETRPWLGKNQWIQDVDVPNIAQMARSYQPGMLVVDRTIHGEFENYRTPEQQIPDQVPDYPWESCITLGNGWYSYSPADNLKSSRWAIHTLIKIVAKGGNFLLGIGPDQSGDLVPEVYERLEEISAWMKVNSVAIYDTKPMFPYQMGKLCFTQSKDNKTRFAFYLQDENEPLPEWLELPAEFVKLANSLEIQGFAGKIKVVRKTGKVGINIPKVLRQNLNLKALVIKCE